jgi:hypothetical protein
MAAETGADSITGPNPASTMANVSGLILVLNMAVSPHDCGLG